MNHKPVWPKETPIKRCPFCGGGGRVIDADEYNLSVQCTACGSKGPMHPTEGGAVRDWNKRA